MHSKNFLRLFAVFLFVSVLLHIGSSGFVASAQRGWIAPMNISKTAGLSRFPRVVGDAEGQLHIVWSENVLSAPGNWGDSIFYAIGDVNSGFKSVDIVFNAGGSAHLPAIAVDDLGIIHVIWTDNYSLYYMQSPKSLALSSANWSKPRVLSSPSERVYWSDMAVQGSAVSVVWSETDETVKGSISFSQSSDGGKTWSAPQSISTPGQIGVRPHIAADKQARVYAVWAEKQDPSEPNIDHVVIRYSRSVAAGETWSMPASVSTELAALADMVVADDGRVDLVWQQGTAWFGGKARSTDGLYHSYSMNGGSSWSKPVRVAQGYWYFSLASDSLSRLHLVWAEQESWPTQSVFYSLWDKKVWSAPIKIAADQGDSRPRIVITEGNKAHVVWAKNKPNEVYDIFHISAMTDAPPLPTRLFPTLIPTLQPTTASAPRIVASPTRVSTRPMTSGYSEVEPADATQSAWNSLAAGILPILLLVVALVGIRIMRMR